MAEHGEFHASLHTSKLVFDDQDTWFGTAWHLNSSMYTIFFSHDKKENWAKSQSLIGTGPLKPDIAVL